MKTRKDGRADRLLTLVGIFFREFRNLGRRELSRQGLGFSQYYVLSCMEEEPDIEMGELARRIGTSRAAATSIINAMIEKKWAVRRYDPHDRRRVRVKIAASGRAVLEKIEQERNGLLGSLFSDMTPYQGRMVEKILPTLIRNLKELNEKDTTRKGKADGGRRKRD